MFNLRNRHFLSLMDFSPKEINYFLELSSDLKKAKYTGTEKQRLLGKNIATISVMILAIIISSLTFSKTKLGVVIFNSCAHITAKEETKAVLPIKPANAGTKSINLKSRECIRLFFISELISHWY